MVCILYNDTIYECWSDLYFISIVLLAKIKAPVYTLISGLCLLSAFTLIKEDYLQATYNTMKEAESKKEMWKVF